MSRRCARSRNRPFSTNTSAGLYSSSSWLVSIEHVSVAHQKQVCQLAVSRLNSSNSSLKTKFHPGLSHSAAWTEPARAKKDPPSTLTSHSCGSLLFFMESDRDRVHHTPFNTHVLVDNPRIL